MKKILLTYLLVVMGIIANAQKKDKYSSFLGGTELVTNTSLNGRVSMFGNQPSLNSYASYYHKWGISSTFQFANIWNSDETQSEASQEYGLLLNYDNDVTKWLNLGAGYSHWFFSDNAYSLRSLYKDQFTLSAITDVKGWISSVLAGYYTGDVDELYLNLQTSYEFEIENVFKKGNTLIIQPSVSVFASDIEYYNTEAYKSYLFLHRYSQDFPDATAGDIKQFIVNPENRREQRIGEKIAEKPGRLYRLNQLSNNLVISDLFEEKSEFNFSNFGFSLPIYYYWGNFMINLGYTIIKPVNQPSYYGEDWTGYANFGLSYFILWE